MLLEDYEVVITLNGNIFKTIETVEGDPNFGINKEGMTSSDGNLVINPNNNTLGAITLNYHPGISAQYKALKSQLCDFTYSIDNGANKEDTKVHTFGFDEGAGAKATSVTTTPESVASNTTLKGLEMTLNSITFTDTYCGNQFDTDGDGYKDYKKDEKDKIDNCRTIFNPDQDDTDEDGIGNVCDNCVHPNPLQIDTDGDGKGDDVIVNGILEQCDNCKLIANFDQEDSDGDKIGDVCDNCKTIYNKDQKDTNNNGIGDVCEGLDQGEGEIAIAGIPSLHSRFVGDKQYELSNHLGNVLSVISDRSIFKENIGYFPDVLSYSDYYPFGSLVPNRHGSSASYRYGYNGKEKDDELKGEGNSIDFGDRMYDPRIGRWSSTDRLQSKYPWISPYSYVANNPIMNREIDGRDWTITTIKDEKGNTTIKMTLDAAVVNTSNNKALDMHCLKDAVKKQVETSYSMTYKNDDGTTTTVEATVNIRSIDKVTELVDSEHLIEVVDPSNPGLGGRTNYGRAPFNGDQLYINETKVDNIINGNDDNTVPHELGHTLGLNHPDKPLPKNIGKPGQDFIPNVPNIGNNVNNAMYSGNSGYLDDKTSTEINKDQINIAQDNYDKCKLNQDTKGK